MLITLLPPSENVAMMEMRSGYSVQPNASSGLMNSTFTNGFFPQSCSMCNEYISDFFF